MAIRDNVAIYPEIRAERWGREEREYLEAKRPPKYVFSSSRNACLLHKVIGVDLRWWTCGPSGDYLVRLQSPKMFARCACGMSFRIHDSSAKTCDLPAPDAVLCGKCHGEGHTFARNKKHPVAREFAKLRLGCAVSGEAE